MTEGNILRFFWSYFLSLYWICYSIISVLCFGFLATRHVGSQLRNQGWNLIPGLPLHPRGHSKTHFCTNAGDSQMDSETSYLTWTSLDHALVGVQSLSRVWLFVPELLHKGSPVLCYLPELTQTHVHRVSDTIQPSHSLSSPSPPAFSLSQHQGLFQWISSSHQVAEILEFQLQHQSFQWIFRTDFL